MCTSDVALYVGEELGLYGFGSHHPFGTDRLQTFWQETQRRGLDRAAAIVPPVAAPRELLERFHTPGYVDRVIRQSATGEGYLDYGDTPAARGIYEASAWVVGSTVDAATRLLDGRSRRALVPIAGLHHARPDSAGGFCVFNDCGIAIETALRHLGAERVAYVDIDAHHGDGVFYAFEHDPDVIVADIHEDGRFLYPGTGWPDETGSGAAAGTKLNLPLPPGAGDDAFGEAWARVLLHLDDHPPDIVLLQCGADGLAGDPLTHLQYSRAMHRQVATDVCHLAQRHCAGRVLVMGGGGYDPGNIAAAWNDVLEVLLTA
jgi:acetoin utilization protein AcuC